MDEAILSEVQPTAIDVNKAKQWSVSSPFAMPSYAYAVFKSICNSKPCMRSGESACGSWSTAYVYFAVRGGLVEASVSKILKAELYQA